MKRIFLATLMIAGLATVISCNNGEYLAAPTGTIPPPGGLGSAQDCENVGKAPLSAMVDGNEFVAQPSAFTDATVIDTNGTDGIKYLYITGHNNAFDNGDYWISMLVSDYRGVNTYYFFKDVPNVAFFAQLGTEDGIYTTATGGVGQITVYRDDPDTLAGTFYMEPQNAGGAKKKICGGYFKLPKN